MKTISPRGSFRRVWRPLATSLPVYRCLRQSGNVVLRGKRIQKKQERLRVKGLRHEMVEAAALSHLPVRATRMRRYGDQYRTLDVTAAKLIRYFESITVRHFNIEKRDIWMELCCFGQCLRAVLRKSNVIPFAP